MTNANFSKRERAAIAIATLTFIGLSTVAHLAIGGFVETHMPRWAMPADDRRSKQIVWGAFWHVKPSPTPVPTPTPTPTPHAATATPRSESPAPRHSTNAIAPSHGRRTPEPGRTPADVQPDSTASPDVGTSPFPTSSATPTSGGGEPKPATPATFKNKVIPEYSTVCIDEGAGGRVAVDVTIDPDGSLAAAWVGQTSGFACLDAAALSAAKESTYNPPEVGGRPVAETYLILYEFSIDS
jgi:protein TonB